MGALFLCSLLLSNCVSSTQVRFNSEPEGADVFVDGQKIGKTPTEMKISNAFGRNNPHILLKKEGYQDLSGGLKHETHTTNLICGILIWLPSLFYVEAPKSYQYYVLKKQEK